MRAAQRLVRLADLNDREFVPIKGESRATFRARILSDESNEGKVAPYAAAMRRHDVFPPIYALLGQDGELSILEGWHRCAAAALCARAKIRAVVIEGASKDEADIISTALFELSDWRAQLEFVSALAA